jgi:hypothetical protein
MRRDMSVSTKKTENLLYVKAADCFDSLKLAIQTFEEFLKEPTSDAAPVYYRARNYLRDAEKFFAEAVKEAKRLLGPLPVYATADFEKWRAEFLVQQKVVADSRELDGMRDELLKDEQLARWVGREDIERLLAENFEAQQTGKRRLANIKIRIVLDRLEELISSAAGLRKSAMEKLQKGG